MANQTDSAAVLETAKADLLGSLRQGPREVLEAKIRVVANQRDVDVTRETAQISQEYAAKGSFNSGARMQACWTAAEQRTRSSTDALLDECLSIGASEAVIAAYLAADASHFLEGVVLQCVGQSTGKHPGHDLRVLAEFMMRVPAHASGIRDIVRSRYHDFEQEKGTRLERRLKWLVRRPAVTIAVSVWVLLTSVYAHVDLLRKLKEAVRHWGK